MRHIVIGTAGHIDHGKSSLVLALTGIDPDRLKEEKARGITIDLGFAHMPLGDDLRVAFVDVPGHERFVRNMLAGATGIDAVLLIIAADESVMPQTREHFSICRLLGVRAGAIVLTKRDLADDDLIAIARQEAQELVAGSFLDGAAVVDVSVRTGEGLEALRAAIRALADQAPPRAADGPARLPIDRAFSMKGFGAVVTGTLVSGRLRVEDDVELLPEGRRVRVRGLQMHGERVREAASGQRVAVNLGDIEASAITRGDSLVTPGAFECSSRCDVALQLLKDARPLRHGARVRVHQGTREVMGRVSVVEAVQPGARAHARLRLEAPMVLTRGDRLVLRAYSPVTTIGGGIVLDPQPPRAGVRSTAGQVRFAQIDPGDDVDVREAAATARAVQVMLDERGRQGLEVRSLVARAGLSPAEAEALATGWVRAGRAVRAGDRLVAASIVESVTASLVAQVAQHHQAQPDSDGLPREEARARLDVAPKLFDQIVERLAAEGRVTGRDRLAQPGHRAAVPDVEAAQIDAIDALFRESALKPPEAADVAQRAGLNVATADKLVGLLVRQRRLVRLGTLVFHHEALARLKEETRALKASAPAGKAAVDVASFKAKYDVSRKYAIPLLEYLDRERVTRRVGDERIVL
jgi:selenocysteine-specific elongation factor